MEKKILPICQIGRVVTGKTPRTEVAEFYDGDIMFITPNELHGEYIVETSTKTITEAGLNSIKSNSISGTSVMVGCIGWDMGNAAICREICATNQQINSITDIKEQYNPFYIYYWLRTKKDYLFSIASVTRTPILSKSTFEQIEIPLPKKYYQDLVAKVLETIDRKITLNSRVNDNLQQMAKTIYDYWFTQFDFPDENGKPYRSAGGQMVWNEQLKREIPARWTVSSIVSNTISSVIKPGVKHFAYKEYLATAEVNGTSISNGLIIDYNNRESRANMQPTINSVWFAKMKNSVKHLFLNKEMQPLIEGVILSTGFCGIQCNDIAFEYISSFISSDYFETIKDILAHGATQEAVNNEDMLSIRLIIPDDIILRKYHKATEAIFSQVSKNICENRQLISLRDWLLPMLMSGQATVSD